MHGYCVLAAPPSAEPLVPLVVCAACRHAIEARLDELLRRVLRRGVEPSDEFRFREVVHREGLRYDVPIEWTCTDRWGRANDAVEDDDDAKAAFVRAFARLHVATDVVARAALAAVISRAADERFPSVNEVPKAGCVISHPRASTQTWHSDGDEPGLFNAFVPLLSLTAANLRMGRRSCSQVPTLVLAEEGTWNHAQHRSSKQASFCSSTTACAIEGWRTALTSHVQWRM